jgi:hypothetical protein
MNKELCWWGQRLWAKHVLPLRLEAHPLQIRCRTPSPRSETAVRWGKEGLCYEVSLVRCTVAQTDRWASRSRIAFRPKTMSR